MTGTRAEGYWLRRGPVIVAVLVAVTLLGSWLAVLAIDVLDLFGLRTAMFVQRQSEYPYVFYHLFADNHPVEWVQWLLLIVAIVALGVTAGVLRARHEGAWGTALLAAALGVVALQDSGNQRHVAANLAEGIAGETASTMVAAASLALVGLLAIGGLVAAWPALRPHASARRLFLAGYAVYGLVGVMDLRSDLWYGHAGRAVMRLLGGRLLEAPTTWEPGLLEWLVFDAFVEESLELAATGLLAAAALVLLRAVIPQATRPAVAARRPVSA